jgi:phosphonate transport system substrate-binding protein
MHVENYAASVTALATGRAHVAWLGAVTTAQAMMQMGRTNLLVLGTRDIDKGFVTYFVAHHGKPASSRSRILANSRAPRREGWNFTFGSRSSTSSHLMPRKFFMEQAGRYHPKQVFRTVAYSGSHDVVMQHGRQRHFTLGAMNFASWDKASEELQRLAPVVYKTPSLHELRARRSCRPRSKI